MVPGRHAVVLALCALGYASQVGAGTEVGLKAKGLMAAGKLVGDDIVIGIIKDRYDCATLFVSSRCVLHVFASAYHLPAYAQKCSTSARSIKEDDCKDGFILDGFPRTLPQAKELDKLLAQTGECVNSVIELSVPFEVLEERICGRWIHKKSGRSYHVKFAPPKSMGSAAPTPDNMKDDVTGEPLMQRPDDTAGALVKRLDGYSSETLPILAHYGQHGIVSRVNANQSMDGVWSEIDGELSIGAH